jgi:hypothetical protein
VKAAACNDGQLDILVPNSIHYAARFRDRPLSGDSMGASTLTFPGLVDKPKQPSLTGGLGLARAHGT